MQSSRKITTNIMILQRGDYNELHLYLSCRRLIDIACPSVTLALAFEVISARTSWDFDNS